MKTKQTAVASAAGPAARVVTPLAVGRVLSLAAAGLAAGLLSGCVNVDDSVSARPSELWKPPAEARRSLQTPAADNVRGIRAAEVTAGQSDSAHRLGSATATIGLNELDLTALIDIALENNPQTRISWFRAKASAASLGQAESGYYPWLTLGADITGLHTRNQTLPGTNNTFRYGPSLSLNWLLFNFGAREAQADAAREALFAANYGFNQSFQQVVRDVAVAYYQFYAAQAQVEASKAYLKNAETTAESAKKKLDSGLGNRPDYLRAFADVSSANARLQSNYADIEAARANLAAVLGVAVSDSLRVTAPVDIVNTDKAKLADQDVNKLIVQAISAKPSLLAAQALVRANEADLRAARAALWPEISLGATGSYYRFSGGTYPGNPQEQYSAGLAISWDIFQGFNRKYAISGARAQLRAEQETLRQAELDVISQVWTSYYAYRSSLRQVEAAEAAVEAQQDAYQAVKKGYESGINSLLDLLTSQQALDASQEQAINARANVGISLANLALATGSLE